MSFSFDVFIKLSKPFQVGPDPDADRFSKIKEAEEKLRQAMRAKPAAKPKRSRDSGANANIYGRDHDEGSEDEGGISLAAIKNKYKKGGGPSGKQSASQIYSDSDDGSEGSDMDVRRHKKLDKSKISKALRDSDDESGGSGDQSDHNESEKNESGGSRSGTASEED